MTEERLKILIQKYPSTTLVSLAREWKMDHSTLVYYVKKLRAKGVIMIKNQRLIEPESSKLIDKVIKDIKYNVPETENKGLKKRKIMNNFTLVCQNKDKFGVECGCIFKSDANFLNLLEVQEILCPKCSKPFRG